MTKRRRTVDDDVRESPKNTAKKALSPKSEEVARPNRPEGLLVLKISDRSQLRAELSSFTGTDEFVLQRWIKTKAKGWVRTKARIGVPEALAGDLATSVAEAAAELSLPPRKKRSK